MLLEVENIGGLLGKHRFLFKAGLNLLLSSNAMGSSSTVRALALLAGGEKLEGVLHELADSGSVRLRLDDGTEYRVALKRTASGPFVVDSNIINGRAVDCVVVNEDHPLNRRLDPDSVKAFIVEASDLARLSEDKLEAQRKLDALKAKLAELEKKIEGMDKLRDERNKVEDRIDALKAEQIRLSQKIREGKVPARQRSKRWKQLMKLIDGHYKDIGELEEEITLKEKERIDLEARIAGHKKLTKPEELDERIKRLEAEKDRLELLKGKASKYATLTSASAGLGYPPARCSRCGAEVSEGEACPGCKLPKAEIGVVRPCPVCFILGVSCDLSTLSPEEYATTLGRVSDKSSRSRDRLQDEYSECVRKLHEAERSLKSVSEDERTLKGNLAAVRSELKALREDLTVEERKLSVHTTEKHALEKLMSEDERTRARAHDVKLELELLAKRRDALGGALDSLPRDRDAHRELELEVEKWMKNVKTKGEALDSALNMAREIFNGCARGLLQEIGLKGFEDVTIDGDFRVSVRRDGYTQPASELSTSEATTLTILLALAAKKAHFRSFPFFAVDTVTTSYDPDKQRKLIEYLGRESGGAAIVTVLVKGEHSPEIVHEYPS